MNSALVFLIFPLVLGLYAQWKVKSAYGKTSKIAAASGLSGRQTAQAILDANGIMDVEIEETRGFLGDHYDPRHKVLRLSPDVYHGRSLASLGIAAHEVGHAIQHATSYAPLSLRNAVVPLASVGSNIGMGLIFFGFMLGALGLATIGLVLYSFVAVFQLINLPVEYDASARAKKILFERGMITANEKGAVASVLDAAALTYVAATVSSILYVLYYAMQLGLIGGRRD